MTPRVSICVPNLNTRAYLPERFRTIQDQTFTDWELLVFDSGSDDGAWEYIQEVAAREPRMRAWQGPREGIYAGWNACLAPARGEYVYIATSDDTMPPECLARLVAALDAHPDCDIAHCRLRIIDEHGRERPDWWREASVFALSSGPLIDHLHVRRAPFDGLLHLAGDSVYTSITQLLIRRSLFARIGVFETWWGSVCDFNWDMRAGLVANTVHVPDTWGGWRVHAAQATAGSGIGTRRHAQSVDAMIDHAIAMSAPLLDPAIHRPLVRRWAAEAHACRSFQLEIKARPDAGDRRRYIAHQVVGGSHTARSHVRARLLRRPPWLASFPDLVRRWLSQAGVNAGLVLAKETST